MVCKGRPVEGVWKFSGRENRPQATRWDVLTIWSNLASPNPSGHSGNREAGCVSKALSQPSSQPGAAVLPLVKWHRGEQAADEPRGHCQVQCPKTAAREPPPQPRPAQRGEQKGHPPPPPWSRRCREQSRRELEGSQAGTPGSFWLRGGL